MERQNNFDALRLIAASLVIFSHAFLIAEGHDGHEPLVMASGRELALGHVGVFIFFVISGYLVTKSLEATGANLRFAAKRALRIFPGLWGSLLVTGLVLGPIATRLPLREYLAQPGLYAFLAHNAAFDVHVNGLPGVLFSENSVGAIANGSLWTLLYEAMMYLMVLSLGRVRLLTPWVTAGLMTLGIAGLLWPWLGDRLGGWGWLLSFFAAGMCAARLPLERFLDRRLALAASLGLALAIPFGRVIPVFPLLGGYLVIFLAFYRGLPILPAARFGDLSYGLYLYGWPVEEMVMYLSHGRAPWWAVFALGLLGAGALAFLSWRFIEAPALRWKPAIRGREAGPPLAPRRSRPRPVSP
ncbi:MAG TPA: acyltransferase [Stellaceae bacterium]|nr:acyltransferase [Stellaceae bacterium]